MKINLLSGIILVFGMNSPVARAEEALVVHEWGTFTSIQDAKGDNLYGAFINNEPTPDFVHVVEGVLPAPAERLIKGALPRSHPSINMRLETPVLYFYPPDSAELPLEVTVKASMRGGWLTEFYPRAKSNITTDDVTKDKLLDKDFIGTLEWEKLKVGGEWAGPETTEKVWLAPRKVASSSVQTPEGESEQYLFYRGVANLDSPLKVKRIRRNNEETLKISAAFQFPYKAFPAITDMWLVHARYDYADNPRKEVVAMRPVSAIGNRTTTVTVEKEFEKEHYSSDNLTKLKKEMHSALVRHGLFDDEATAMLATWEESYFKTPGVRLFFIVPRAWVDHYLPLDISVPAETERVMMGRIELL